MKLQRTSSGKTPRRSNGKAGIQGSTPGQCCCGEGGHRDDCPLRTESECEHYTFLSILHTATGGTFTIVIDGNSTGPLAYNISIADLISAIEGLDPSYVGHVYDFTQPPDNYIIGLDETLGDLSGLIVVTDSTTGGAFFYNLVYGPVQAPSFWRIDVADVAIDPASSSSGGVSRSAGGSVDRTYYASGIQYSATSMHIVGKYFTSKRSANSSFNLTATDGMGTERADWLFLSGSLLGPPDDKIGANLFSVAGTASLYVGNIISTGGVSHVRCTATSSSGNTYTGFDFLTIGDGGTITFTPCPPCPKACDPPSCVNVDVDLGTCDIAGRYAFAGFIDYVDLDIGVSTGGGGTIIPDFTCSGLFWSTPAGCVWVWQRDSSTFLYVWWDGKDWRATIVKTGIPTNPDCAGSAGRFAVVELVDALVDGAGFDCNDGIFTGTLTLRTVEPNTNGGVSGCDATVATVFFGDCDCPTDCTIACPRVELLIENFTDPDDAWQSFEKDTLSGFYPAECVFTSTGCRLECIDGFWVATVDAAQFSGPDDPRGWKAKAPVDPIHPTRIPSDPALWVVEYGTQFGGDPMDVLGVRFKQLGGTEDCTPP